MPPRITWLGHSTVLIELDGVRLLTDPLLRSRVVHLRREGAAPAPPPALDAVLLSHLHHDHADLASLKRIEPPRILCPVGAGDFLGRAGFPANEELAVGTTRQIGAVAVEATPAEHFGRRQPFGPRAQAIGFVVRGERTVYFAGDTDLFDEMASLGPLDVALLPIAGYGPGLGPGHLDPERAARAAALLRPRIAIPIHWGTLHPRWAGRGAWFTQPPHAFAAHVAELAPDVTVGILAPGEALEP